MGGYWHRVLVAALAAAAIDLSGIGAAHAQETLPDYRRPGFGSRGIGTADWVFVPNLQTVYQRPRPDYDPVGIRLGNFDVSTQLGISGVYDDNVFASDTDTKSDVIGVLTPGIRVRSDWPVHLLGFEATGEIDRYASETSQDSEFGGGTVFGRLDITGEDTLFGSAGFRREIERNDDEENQGGGITEFNRAIERLGYAHQFARVNVRVNASHQRVDFLKNVDDDRDRDQVNVGGRITYALSPRFTPFVEAGFRDTNFDDNVDDQGLNRDSKVYSVSVGGRVLITEVLLSEFSIGAQHVDFDDPTLQSDTSPLVTGDLIWNVTPLTSLILEGHRLQAVSTQTGTGGKIDTGGTLRLEHELMENLLVFGSAGYRNVEFEDTDRTDDRVRAAVGGEFLLNQNVSFSAQYQFDNRNSTDSDFDFVDNMVIFTTRLQY